MNKSGARAEQRSTGRWNGGTSLQPLPKNAPPVREMQRLATELNGRGSAMQTTMPKLGVGAYVTGGGLLVLQEGAIKCWMMTGGVLSRR